MILSTWYFHLHCVLLIFYSVGLPNEGAKRHDDDDGEDDEEFVSLSAPPDPFTWHTRLKAKYVCTTDKIIGVTLLVSTGFDDERYGRQFRKIWRCRGNKVKSLQFRNVRLRLADDIAFRPSLFNPHYTIVSSAKIIVWMVDAITWWKLKQGERRGIHNWALSSEEHNVKLLPPYSRPYKRFRKRCPQWYWKYQQYWLFSDSGTCPVEQQNISLLSFPAVFNGQVYGIIHSLSPFTNPVLEHERIRSLLSPRFSVELWVYIVDYCPMDHLNRAGSCTVFAHVSTRDDHLTPVLLVNQEGNIQVESRGPDMYHAHKTVETIPRHQWVRILFTLEHTVWRLEWSYGKDHTIRHKTNAEYDEDVHFDETEGYFVIGGIDGRIGSFRGYYGRVKLYRGRILTLDELKMPEPTDPIFQLDTQPREKECQQFRQWVHHRVNFYSHKAAIYEYRRFCSNMYKELMIRRSSNPLLLSCPRLPSRISKDKVLVARLLRSAIIRDGYMSTRDRKTIARRLVDAVTAFVEEHGLADMHVNLPLLEQSSCLGNLDATYMLAVFLNNGIGTTVREHESLSLLMQGSLNKHRLSSLALGHRHVMGLDGVPHDKDIAYMYYKDIGDKTREEKDIHPEDLVLTESIRLMDEQTLEQQMDEKGDLFMWLKHQAQQGVQSAQSHLAKLYFWGSQGMRRNLQAARHLFQQGAAQGDADSMYNLGIMDILGRGSAKKNETAGKEQLKRAAKKKHPYAISALGWIAMEQEYNYKKAAELFEEAFQMQFMDAGYYLGHMHHHGLYPNTKADSDIAVKYYEWAAMRGHVYAALLFAQFQSKGTHRMRRNTYLAMEWARFIAEQNSEIGKLLRAGVTAYREGNIPLAAYHYLLSSEAGVEVASFNLAWLCEEHKERVTAAISKECQWRHYNLTVQREVQFVDPYSYIKMGDYFWYGCQGQRNITLAAQYYAQAGRKMEPHALFNLAFMVEEGAMIPTSVWESLDFDPKDYSSNATMLMELYERCRESPKSEAFIPCTLALYRVWLVDLWNQYHIYLKTSTYLGCVVAVIGTIYFMIHCVTRFRQQRVHPHQL